MTVPIKNPEQARRVQRVSDALDEFINADQALHDDDVPAQALLEFANAVAEVVGLMRARAVMLGAVEPDDDEDEYAFDEDEDDPDV